MSEMHTFPDRRPTLGARLARRLRRVFTLPALGHDLSSRARLLWLGLWLPVRELAGFRGRAPSVVTIRKFGSTRAFHIWAYSDLVALSEVFQEEPYRISLPAPPRIIVDLGSNVGCSVLYLGMRYPDARIFAYEANPAIFPRLEANVGNRPEVTVRQAMVAGEDGVGLLYPHRSHLSASFVARPGSQAGIEVLAASLNSIIDDLPYPDVDLLKFDIEGAECAVFKACTSLDRIGFLVGEVHADLMKCTVDDFLRLFEPAFDISLTLIAPQRVAATMVRK